MPEDIKPEESNDQDEPKVSAPIPAEAAGGEEEEQKTEASEQKSEDGGQKTEDGSQKTEKIKEHVVDGSKKVADISKKAAAATGEVLKHTTEKVKDYDPKTSIHVLDKLLNWARDFCPPETFEKISNWCAKYGHVGIVIAQILTAVFFIVEAFKAGTLSSGLAVLLRGAATVLLLVILQYAAEKFLRAGKRFIESTPSRLNSPAFLDCAALLLEISGILIFATLIVQDGFISVSALIGLAVWCLLEAIAVTAIHPVLVNTVIEDDVSAGEEAIGILSFFAKSALKIVPIAYGVGSIIGALALVGGIGTLLMGNLPIAGMKAINLIVVFAALPLASYVLFIVYHLLIDILQAILAIPRKLDDLNK